LGNSIHFKTLDGVHNTDHYNSSKQSYEWPLPIALHYEWQRIGSVVNTTIGGWSMARPY
jgi:hypothetical protein